MTFPARCPGTCVECGARFHTGDPITNNDEGWVHASCADPTDDNREPCTQCWLTICDCDKDT